MPIRHFLMHCLFQPVRCTDIDQHLHGLVRQARCLLGDDVTRTAPFEITNRGASRFGKHFCSGPIQVLNQSRHRTTATPLIVIAMISGLRNFLRESCLPVRTLAIKFDFHLGPIDFPKLHNYSFTILPLTTRQSVLLITRIHSKRECVKRMIPTHLAFHKYLVHLLIDITEFPFLLQHTRILVHHRATTIELTYRSLGTARPPSDEGR